MKESLYSRNAVYEILRAKRRQPFSLEIAEGAQEKGRLCDILRIAGHAQRPAEFRHAVAYRGSRRRAWRGHPAGGHGRSHIGDGQCFFRRVRAFTGGAGANLHQVIDALKEAGA